MQGLGGVGVWLVWRVRLVGGGWLVKGFWTVRSGFWGGVMLVRVQEENGSKRPHTTLQSKVNAKLSPHRFWPCHENGLIKTIQTITHNL